MSTEVKWAEWHHSRDQYDDKQDWLDARPDPVPGSIKDATERMAKTEATATRLSQCTDTPA
jgi:hypothetical protein